MTQTTLFSPLQAGPLHFKNRIFMAPMTRSRAPEQVPNDLMVTYYQQRASAGLIFSEGSQISQQGVGYISTPGIHTQEQIAGWKKVTTAVHQAGGLIFCQLWHVGRASHPDFHAGNLPVAPSAITVEGQSYTPDGFKALVQPHALSLTEIAAVIADYKQAAQAAKDAGFDGVEVHGANGYLPAQFLEDGSNQRSDRYGGSLEKRARFLLEITDAAIDVWGPERVCVRLSPRNPFNGMHDSDPEGTYLYLVQELARKEIGFLHLIESADLADPLAPRMREIFTNNLILNANYTQQKAEEAIQSGQADAIAFGKLFIANPDLPRRFKEQAELSTPEQTSIYGGGAQGYTDYPALS